MTQIAGNLVLANRRLMKKLLVVAAIMFGFGFALVPFYEKICEVTCAGAVLRKDLRGDRDPQCIPA